jgi:hypothetical protein
MSKKTKAGHPAQTARKERETTSKKTRSRHLTEKGDIGRKRKKSKKTM